jgi:serine phosphatase RsbU (regulator of sigma subunit)
LRGLNRILSGQLRDQFVSAAYLWLDTENRKAPYSAAGHPPLLHWREGKLEGIESNGLLFGVTPDPDYPFVTCRSTLAPPLGSRVARKLSAPEACCFGNGNHRFPV